MNKICTSKEQSKKLIELGIDVNTADMHYYKNSFGDYIEGLYNSSDLKEGCELKGIEYIPAWSLAALLNAVKYNTINLHYNDVRNDWIASCTIEHSTRYESVRALNPIDAVFEMIVKLNEHKLL